MTDKKVKLIQWEMEFVGNKYKLPDNNKETAQPTPKGFAHDPRDC